VPVIHVATHDLLVARYIAHDVDPTEEAQVRGLLETCDACAALERDLLAITSALPDAMPPLSGYRRDFIITPDQARELRRSPIERTIGRWVDGIRHVRGSLLQPLAGAAVTIGVVMAVISSPAMAALRPAAQSDTLLAPAVVTGSAGASREAGTAGDGMTPKIGEPGKAGASGPVGPAGDHAAADGASPPVVLTGPVSPSSPAPERSSFAIPAPAGVLVPAPTSAGAEARAGGTQPDASSAAGMGSVPAAGPTAAPAMAASNPAPGSPNPAIEPGAAEPGQQTMGAAGEGRVAAGDAAAGGTTPPMAGAEVQAGVHDAQSTGSRLPIEPWVAWLSLAAVGAAVLVGLRVRRPVSRAG
jgi:hypothetical protein